jgi:hypothetical protein
MMRQQLDAATKIANDAADAVGREQKKKQKKKKRKKR